MLMIGYSVLILAVLGALFGVLLAFAAKKFAVQEDPRKQKILDALAGANCGGCGYPGCEACAKAILAGEAPVDSCAPSGASGAQTIAQIMGVSAEAKEKTVSYVRCAGGSETRFRYVGPADCRAAAKVANGQKECEYGCLGFGSCVAVCRFDALHLNARGVAEVDEEKCTNCGACRTACPRGLIGERPYGKEVKVLCSNREKGLGAKTVCENSCIGCGLCAKKCPQGAITMANNLPVIDRAKCVDCGTCAGSCPRGSIAPRPKKDEEE